MNFTIEYNMSDYFHKKIVFASNSEYTVLHEILYVNVNSTCHAHPPSYIQSMLHISDILEVGNI